MNEGENIQTAYSPLSNAICVCFAAAITAL